MSRRSTPHLVFVSHRFQVQDGQGRVNYEVVKAALDRGFRVTMLAGFCAEELASHPRASFVRVGYDWLPTGLLKIVGFAWDSQRWLRRNREQYDLVQATGFVTWEPCDVVSAHFVHGAWGKSIYYPFHGRTPYSIYQKLFTTLNARWERLAFQSAKRIVGVSAHVARQLRALQFDGGKLRVIYNGVDTDHFHPGPSERDAFPCLPSDRPVALFVGDIRTPRKNLDTVLRALQAVPGVTLAVAGAIDGSPFPVLAGQLGLGDRVIFLDKVENMSGLMRSVDLFVFPSRYEAHPLVVLEAMASGLPMILSSSFGAADFLGDAGLVLEDPDDFTTLAAQMRELLAAPGRLAEMARAGREAALGMHWSTMSTQYLALYDEMLSRSRHASSEVVQGMPAKLSMEKS